MKEHMSWSIKHTLGILGLGMWLILPANAQVSPVRLRVNKVQNKDTRTAYRSSYGTYRHEQSNETVYYEIELVNFSAGAISNCVVKWNVLHDPSYASALGGGISYSTSRLEIQEGQKICILKTGQKYVLQTDPIELSIVSTYDSYGGGHSRYGGDVRGYLVEVYVHDRLVAQDASANNIREQIENLRKTAERKRPQR